MQGNQLKAEITLELRAGLSAIEVERRLAQANRAGDVRDRTFSFYLLDLASRGAYQELGFHSIVQYAETRYGISPSTTREYLAVGRALAELPLIQEAIDAGGLLWSQVRLLTRIATAQTEAEWIAWARGRTVRELAAQVRLRDKGDRPRDPNRRRIHSSSFKIEGNVDVLGWEIWNTSRSKMEAETGRQMSDGEMMVELARQHLVTQPDGTIPGRRRVNESHFKVHVYHVENLATVVATADGPEALDVTTARALLIAAGREDLAAGIEDPLDDADENSGPDVPESERDVPTPPAMLARVLARDGYRCRCCGGKENLTGNHKKWRRKGGRTVDKNLFGVCEPCHSLIHDGYLIARGTIPHELYFTDRHGRRLAEIAPATGEALLLLHAQRDARASDHEHTPEWWLEHEHLLELGPRGLRIKQGAMIEEEPLAEVNRGGSG